MAALFEKLTTKNYMRYRMHFKMHYIVCNIWVWSVEMMCSMLYAKIPMHYGKSWVKPEFTRACLI